MRPVQLKFVSALVLSGLFAMASAQTIEPSNITFQVAGSAGFPILKTGTGSILDYDLDNDSVDFTVGATGSYDNPFFCFDFSEPESADVSLNATDAGGHVVMDSVGLASDLSYASSFDELANELTGTISFSPSSSVQCFYTSTKTIDDQSQKVFGLFGSATTSRDSDSGVPACSDPDVGEGDDCRFFVDDFAAYPDLEVSFENFHIVIDNEPVSLDGVLSVSADDEIVYEIVISNSGKGDAESIALQEVFPSGGSFDAGLSLSDGGWACVDNWDNILCPDNGTGALRLQNIYLPAGGQMTFTISRYVQQDSIGQIHLFAGAVNGSGTNVESAADEAVLDVIGEPAQLEFAQQPTDTTLGQLIDPPVAVEVVDSNGNRVTTDHSTNVALELYLNGNEVDGDLASGVVTSGVVSFDSLDTTGLELGTGYQIKAKHSAINPTISERNSNEFELLSLP